MARTRHPLLGALAFALVASPLFAQAPGWQIDPDHTSVQFAVSHMRTSTVRGRFNKTAGTVKWDGKDFSSASVEIVTDVASIDTGVPKRDAHLRTADFLMLEKHPTIIFKSVKIEPTGSGRLRMTGNLTIRGVTKPVVLDIAGPSEPVKDLDGAIRIGASATTTIDRRDFGLRWNRVLEAGGLLVGFQVTITIDIEIVKREGGEDGRKQAAVSWQLAAERDPLSATRCRLQSEANPLPAASPDRKEIRCQLPAI